jgi:hypothetical protein
MAACIKSIAVGKKDAILFKWKMTVRDQENRQDREDRLVSFIIKQALLSFVQTGTFIEIGRIHFNPRTDIVKNNARINLWLDDFPELIEWTKTLENRQIVVTKAYKEVLLHCITIVPEDEEEYIPSYYDFVKHSSGIINTIMATANPKEVIPAAIPKILPEKQSVIQKPNNSVKPPTAVTEKTKEDKKEADVINSLGLGVKR